MTASAFDISAIIENTIRNTAYLRFPKSSAAPAPHDKSKSCSWRIDATSVHNDFRLNMWSTCLDLWARVLGERPPIWGNVEDPKCELKGIAFANACFLGVNRPIGEDNQGNDVLAYIVKPEWYYIHEPSMTGVVKLRTVPLDLVFVVYVKLDAPYNDGGGNEGVVTHWSTVESDKLNPYLPRDHSKRFSHRLW